MRTATLPPQWACLEGKVRHVQQVSHREFSASCPKCGGDIHHDGSLPDRCRIFADEHPTLWCRRCGLLAFPDQFGDAKWPKPTAEELERWRAERTQSEEERRRSAERALAHLKDERIWEAYHDAMDEQGRNYWRRRGIPDAWQEYWMLGWRHEYRVCSDGNWTGTPAAVIPLFGFGCDFLNLKYRLLNPPPTYGKYRYELTGQAQPMFLCDPYTDGWKGHIVAIEGELKAAVTSITLNDPTVSIVGLPGTNPSPDIIAELREAERVTLVMDPGAELAADKMAASIGKGKVRKLITPDKIDDAILQGLSRNEVRSILRMAVPA